MTLRAAFREIGRHELVSYLLRESGQAGRDAVDVKDLLTILRLEHLELDMSRDLDIPTKQGEEPPRALFSFDDRLVVTQVNQSERRVRFGVLHEMAHYVIPSHVEKLFLCRESDLSLWTRRSTEREANEFAAELLFQGGRFTLEANSLPVSATTVKILGTRYNSSFEATARRLVVRNLKPCFLVVLAKTPSELQSAQRWKIRYQVYSQTFGSTYFTRIAEWTDVDPLAEAAFTPGRDIADSLNTQERVALLNGEDAEFQAEFFTNHHNVFCFFTPVPRPRRSSRDGGG